MNRAVFGAVALAMVASSGQAATTEVQFRSFNFLDSLAVDNAVFAGTPFDGSEGLVEFERASSVSEAVSFTPFDPTLGVLVGATLTVSSLVLFSEGVTVTHSPQGVALMQSGISAAVRHEDAVLASLAAATVSGAFHSPVSCAVLVQANACLGSISAEGQFVQDFDVLDLALTGDSSFQLDRAFFARGYFAYPAGLAQRPTFTGRDTLV